MLKSLRDRVDALEVAAAILAAYASVAVVLGRHVHPGRHEGIRFPGNWIDGIRIWDVVVWLLLAVALWFVLHVLRAKVGEKWPARVGVQADGHDGYWRFLCRHRCQVIGAFLAMMLGWGIVLLLLWPGASMNDQIGIIGAPLAYSSVHPATYTFPLAWCVNTSNELLGTGNPGFAAFVIAQMVFCAAIVALVVAWLGWRGCGRTVCVVVVAFFALCPVVSDYAVTPLKDTTFSYALLLLVPILFEVAVQRERFWEGWRKPACLVVACLLVGTTRNNGPYVVIGLAIGMGIACARMPHARMRVVALIAAVVLSLAPNKLADAYLGIQHAFSESLSIPLQQVAAVYRTGGEVPEADRDVLTTAVEPVAAARYYAPAFSDPIKLNLEEPITDSGYIQEHKVEFLLAWARMGLANPKTYVQAWLSQTRGCWDPLAKNFDQSFFLELSCNTPGSVEWDALKRKNGLSNHSLLPEAVAVPLRAVYERLLVCPSVGALFLLSLLLALVACWRQGRTAPLAAAVPGLLLWATLMISTPLPSALRYGVYFVLAAPVLAAMGWCGAGHFGQELVSADDAE